VTLCVWEGIRRFDTPGVRGVCRVGDSVTHVKINNDGECYSLLSDGAEAFATIAELVRHYTDDMAKELRDVSGNRIELKYPLPSVDHYSER